MGSSGVLGWRVWRMLSSRIRREFESPSHIAWVKLFAGDVEGGNSVAIENVFEKQGD